MCEWASATAVNTHETNRGWQINPSTPGSGRAGSKRHPYARTWATHPSEPVPMPVFRFKPSPWAAAAFFFFFFLRIRTRTSDLSPYRHRSGLGGLGVMAESSEKRARRARTVQPCRSSAHCPSRGHQGSPSLSSCAQCLGFLFSVRSSEGGRERERAWTGPDRTDVCAVAWQSGRRGKANKGKQARRPEGAKDPIFSHVSQSRGLLDLQPTAWWTRNTGVVSTTAVRTIKSIQTPVFFPPPEPERAYNKYQKKKTKNHPRILAANSSSMTVAYRAAASFISCGVSSTPSARSWPIRRM